MKQNKILLLTALTAMTLQSVAAPTVIQMTDEVLVPNTVRLGINLGENSPSSGATLMKLRAVENFEGTLLRQCHYGPLSETDGMSTWFGVKGDTHWDEFSLNREAVLLTGPQQWERRKIVGIEERNDPKGKTFRFFKFDESIEAVPANSGFMLLCDRPDMGHAVPLHKWWNTASNHFEKVDIRPDGFGSTAYCIAGSDLPDSYYRVITHSQLYGDLNGTWKVRFWAKAIDGPAKLALRGEADRLTYPNPVQLTTKWTKFKETIEVSGIQEPKEGHHGVGLSFVFQSKSADILIDDIEVWQEGDTNPTAFRDECVDTLKQYRPGILRNLQMGGSTIENMLSPRVQMRTFASQKRTSNSPYSWLKVHSYSIPEFYALCEEIGTEPWYCLPGTLLPEELEQFLEYIAGPVDSPMGARRAADGHPKPWTDTLTQIHIEFGNEAWNSASAYQSGGYNGPDYWRSLIEHGKASPNYRSNMVFHSGGQAASPNKNRRIMKNTPNADCHSIGPYIVHELSTEETESWTSENDLFRWAYAWTIDRSLTPGRSMVMNAEYAEAAGIELSTYEINHHITGGNGPLKPRNDLATSIGGGLNVCNGMLLMLKEQNIRYQGLFTFVQKRYRAKAGNIRLWGTALNMREGYKRYRPTFLANQMVNQVIGGDLVKTLHSEGEPTFTATGTFEDHKPNQTLTFPSLWSYAFNEGNRRGLVLFNLDTSEKHAVKIEFDGTVDGATQVYTLTADSITAHNEVELPEPQVVIKETSLPKFRSGTTLNLPPHTMIALTWAVQPQVK